MVFKIIGVDEDGFNGRDNPPSKEDVGLLVSPVKMQIECDTQTCDWISNPIGLDAQRVAREEIREQETGFIRCWTCLTEDGRVLDLVDHELELHRS